MSPLRVLLVSRRFWPLVGDSENTFAELATGLLRFGHQPTVLTAAWHDQWPRAISFDGVPVVRLPLFAASRWGNWRYMLSLRRWLRRQAGQFDVICVSRLRYDADAVLQEAAGGTAPIIVRADDGETGEPARWLLEKRGGRRLHKRLLAADAVIASSPAIAAELQRAKFSPHQIRIIGPSVRHVAFAKSDRSFDARIALADANPDLITTNDTPVAVYIGRMHQDHHLNRLLRAFASVLWQRPHARLWLIGDGPQRAELYELVRDLDLQRSVFMPGAFDDIQGVLQAANAVIDPSESGRPTDAMLRAAAAGLPTIAVDRPAVRELFVRLPREVHLLPRADVSELRDALLAALDKRLRVSRLDADRRQFLKDHSPHTMIAKHIALFRELVESRSGR